MAKATFFSTSKITAFIDYTKGTDNLDRLIADAEAELVEVDAEIPKIEASITAIEAELAESFALIDATTNSLSACIVAQDIEYRLSSIGSMPAPCMPYAEEIAKLQAEAAPISAKLYFERQSLEQAKVRKAFIQAAIIDLNNAKTGQTSITCPCADFVADPWKPSPNATVGTIELLGAKGMPDSGLKLPDVKVVLRPQFSGGGYSKPRDNTAIDSMESEAAMVTSHLASWAWTQEHHPRYIVASLSNLDKEANTCSVKRVTPKQTDEIPGVDYSWSASGVPIDYLDCNADAFVNGDRVIVEFGGQDKSSPEVIGFESHPRFCPGPDYVLVKFVRDWRPEDQTPSPHVWSDYQAFGRIGTSFDDGYCYWKSLYPEVPVKTQWVSMGIGGSGNVRFYRNDAEVFNYALQGGIFSTEQLLKQARRNVGTVGYDVGTLWPDMTDFDGNPLGELMMKNAGTSVNSPEGLAFATHEYKGLDIITMPSRGAGNATALIQYFIQIDFNTDGLCNYIFEMFEVESIHYITNTNPGVHATPHDFARAHGAPESIDVRNTTTQIVEKHWLHDSVFFESVWHLRYMREPT